MRKSAPRPRGRCLGVVLLLAVVAPGAVRGQASYPITITPPSNGALEVLWDNGRGYLQCQAGKPYTSICSSTAPAGAVLQVRAVPSQGYALSAFGGACSGTTNPCSVTVSGAVTLSATFATAPWYTLAMTPPTHGSVTVFRPAGAPFSCQAGVAWSTCTASFVTGTSLMLSPLPDSGGTFNGWSGACSGTGGCNLVLDGNKAVGARLLAACLDAARAAGATDLWLGVWQENPRAIAFYRKHGFEIVGEKTFVVGSDPQTDWVMARPVGAAGSMPLCGSDRST